MLALSVCLCLQIFVSFSEEAALARQPRKEAASRKAEEAAPKQPCLEWGEGNLSKTALKVKDASKKAASKKDASEKTTSEKEASKRYVLATGNKHKNHHSQHHRPWTHPNHSGPAKTNTKPNPKLPPSLFLPAKQALNPNCQS